MNASKYVENVRQFGRSARESVPAMIEGCSDFGRRHPTVVATAVAAGIAAFVVGALLRRR